MQETQSLFRRMVAVGMFLAMATASLFAAPVKSISIQATSAELVQSTLEEMVHAVIKTKVGAEFDPQVLSDDIRALVKVGAFEDVRTQVEPLPDGSVAVSYLLKPKALVRNILIQGNKIYRTSKLRKLITLEPGRQADEAVLAADRNALLAKYRDAGYYGTEVASLQSKPESGVGVDVIYVIREEQRSKLEAVQFVGNTVFKDSELREVMVTKRQWWRYIIRFGNYYNEQQLVLDRDQLKTLYAGKGYMDFAVEGVEERYDAANKWVVLVFKLQEGKPYTINNISIEGNQLFTTEKLLGLTKLRSGMIHDANQEDADLSIMKAEYERLGYMDLRFYPVHSKDSDTQQVDIHYRVSEGGPSRIRDIAIVGNEITQDRVVRRELAIQPEDLGDLGKIRLSKARLDNLGYFERVEIVPVATEMPDLKDLRIELSEKATGHVSLGAGYSTEDSVIGFVEFTESNFNLARLLNWPPKGAGQRLRLRLQGGHEVSNITISHVEPWLFDRRLELTTDLFLRNRYESEYDQRNVGGGLMLSWPLAFRVPGTEHIEYWRMGLGFRVENVKISNVDKLNDNDLVPSDWDFVRDRTIQDEKGDEWANRLILRLSRDTRDAFYFPREGSLVTLQSELVTEAFGSYENFGRFSLSGSYYQPLIRDLVLKLAAEYSTTTSDDPAIFDRYFAGGVGTMRGFKRRDVSPIDEYENPLGGNSMLIGSAEILMPVKNIMFLSVFTDIGSVWWDEFDADLSKLNMSVGVGIQFRALPISLYYGVPVSTDYDHLDGKSGRFHFNIGYSY
jgi:outer membrane protein insertion porin family